MITVRISRIKLNELIINCEMPLIIAVRRGFLELVIENWMFQDPMVIEAKDATVEEVEVDDGFGETLLLCLAFNFGIAPVDLMGAVDVAEEEELDG